MNLHGFNFNNSFYYYDYLGRDPHPCDADLKDNPKSGEVTNGEEGPGTSNCHSYACNNWDKMVPDEDGDWHKKRFDCKDLIAAYKKDGAIDVPEKGCCPKGFHKVYVVVSNDDEGNDFHIYRQDSDGGWTHGLQDISAFVAVLKTDGAGNPIKDPSKANHDYSKPNKERIPESGMSNGYNYEQKCGYLCVKTNP